MKVGVYGGTFNPPHLGHTGAAAAACAILGLDKLLFVPANLPPHKQLSEDAASTACRMEMLSIAVDGLRLGEQAEVSALELERPGKSYTVDTISAIREKYPEAEIYLLMGSDMFLTVQNWYRAGEILAECKIVGFARSEDDSAQKLKAHAEYLQRTFGAGSSVIALPNIVDVSSTRLRAMLAAGEDTSAYLAAPVYGYILRKGLYGTNADLKHLPDSDLRAVSHSMVKAKRIPHIRGTEETAVLLAHRWGVDPDKARRAAILHDCTKYLTLDEQLKLCEEYGIVLDNLERETLKLLHSKTGAAIAKHVFGEPDDVVGAIYYHTTGRPEMTALEKVLYLADYMEPTRHFDGVEKLRRLAELDLDRAVAEGLAMTIEEMNDRTLPVHPATQEALNWLKGNVL